MLNFRLVQVQGRATCGATRDQAARGSHWSPVPQHILNYVVLDLPTMIPIRVLRFFQAHDINVPVVSFKIAHGSMVWSYKGKIATQYAIS